MTHEHTTIPFVTTPTRALRIDDLGASSKRYERHWGKWFPYRELSPDELADLAYWLRKTHSRCTLAITAYWVERHGATTRFDKKFPEQARVIRQMASAGLVEVASHGMYHCVPGKHAGGWWWKSNREWHREFRDGVNLWQQLAQMKCSRDALQQMFDTPVTTLVPPGNLIGPTAIALAKDPGGYTLVTGRIQGVHAGGRGHMRDGLVCDCQDQTILHDRDLVGVDIPRELWRRVIAQPVGTVREILAGAVWA